MRDEGWILNPQDRTLTRALLVYRYSEIVSSGLPIEWQELLPSGQWKEVVDADLLRSLNDGLKYRMAVLEDSGRSLQGRKATKSRPHRRSRSR